MFVKDVLHGFYILRITNKRMRNEVNILLDGKENVVFVFLGKCR